MNPDGVTVHYTREELLVDLWTHMYGAFTAYQDGFPHVAQVHCERHNALLAAYQDALAGDDTQAGVDDGD